MKLETFFEKFDLFANAPDGARKLREVVLNCAMRGQLVAQCDTEESAVATLRRFPSEVAARFCKTSDLPIISEPFAIPRSWSWIRLPRVLRKLTDGTHHSPPNAPSGAFKYVTAKNIKKDGIELSDITFVSQKVHKEIYSRCDPEPGDVLFIKDGATTGIATINQLTEPFSMLSSVALLKCTPAINNRYLLWVLRSPFYYQQIRAAMKGAAITRVNLTDLAASLVPLPPLAEQKRIVAKVDELMALCDRLEAQQQERETQHAALARASLARFADAPTPANLQFLFHPSYAIAPADLRKSILTLAVQGKLVEQNPADEPISELVSRIKLAMEAQEASSPSRGRSELTPIDNTNVPFELPRNWQWMPFGTIANIVGGVTLGRNLVGRNLATFPYLRVANVQSGRLDLNVIKYVCHSQRRTSQFSKIGWRAVA